MSRHALGRVDLSARTMSQLSNNERDASNTPT